MSTAQVAIIATGVSVASVVFLSYLTYMFIKKNITALGIKRIWLIGVLILGITLACIANGILPKIVVIIMLLVPGVLVGHAPVPKFIPDNRRPTSSGKSIFEKILIFFWY